MPYTGPTTGWSVSSGTPATGPEGSSLSQYPPHSSYLFAPADSTGTFRSGIQKESVEAARARTHKDAQTENT